MADTTNTNPASPVSPETQILLQKYWSKDGILKAWQEAKGQLDEVKEREAALRKSVFELEFPSPTEGTQRVPLGNGYMLKAVYPLRYECPKDKVLKFAQTEQGLEELAKLGPEAGFVADRLIEWEPVVQIKEYRTLKPEYKTIVDKFVTIKPGSPQLEIEPPKA
jgi:hypothetical protein